MILEHQMLIENKEVLKKERGISGVSLKELSQANLDQFEYQIIKDSDEL